VLLDAPREEMAKIVDPRVAEAVVQVREERVKVIPGYDGVYGQLVILKEEKKEGEKKPREEIKQRKQRSITDFM